MSVDFNLCAGSLSDGCQDAVVLAYDLGEHRTGNAHLLRPTAWEWNKRRSNLINHISLQMRCMCTEQLYYNQIVHFNLES